MTLIFLLVLTNTSCSLLTKEVVVSVDEKVCTPCSIQSTIDTNITVPEKTIVTFYRKNGITVIDGAILRNDFSGVVLPRGLVIMSEDRFISILSKIGRATSIGNALVVIRKFYENQVAQNNNRCTGENNVSKAK